jgi:hypothetical protein
MTPNQGNHYMKNDHCSSAPLITYKGTNPYVNDIKPGATLVFEIDNVVYPDVRNTTTFNSGTVVPSHPAPTGYRLSAWVAITDKLYQANAVITYYPSGPCAIRVEAKIPSASSGVAGEGLE